MSRIIIGGGGSQEDSKKIDKLLTSMVGSGDLLYIPIAMEDVPYEKCLEWVRSVFPDMDEGRIVMWTDLTGKTYDELGRFSAVYIGGGNTFRLLKHLRETGFDGMLIRFLEDGKIVYGGSAGACVIGRSIEPASIADENSVGLEDLSGLDMLNGFSVWCHYEPSLDAEIIEYAKSGRPSIAIPERSGVFLNGSEMDVVGFESVYVFDEDGKREIRAGKSF